MSSSRIREGERPTRDENRDQSEREGKQAGSAVEQREVRREGQWHLSATIMSNRASSDVEEGGCVSLQCVRNVRGCKA